MQTDYTKQVSEWEAKKSARLEIAKALWATHPHLVPNTGDGLVTAAKNIRIELKAEFPGVKFAVRTSRFSGGDSIDISWTDGPTTKQVESITSQYQAGTFDGMTDCYDYEHSAWTDAFGDGKYVHTQRSYSDSVVRQVITDVCTRLGGMDAIPEVQDYRQGRMYKFQQSGGCDVERSIHVAMSELSVVQS